MTMATADEMMAWVERQAAMGARRAGTAAGRANEDFLASELESFGLKDVRKEPIPIVRWEPGEFSLAIGDGDSLREIPCFPIPYSAFTSPEGARAPLRFVDSNSLVQSGSWQGEIVVTELRFPALDMALLRRLGLGEHDPDRSLNGPGHPATWVRLGWHLYGEAVKRGAAGFIGILRDQPGGSCEMYAPYGFRESDILDKPIPGCWIRRDDGPSVIELARSGRGQARLRSTGTREPGITHNVVGEIPGRGSDELMVLSCHHDSPFTSPVEDGSGVAVVLALAQHFARTQKLRRRLVVLLSAGHFYGSIGTRTFIREHRAELLRRAAIEISIEHIAREAVEDGAGRLVATGLPEPTGVFVPHDPAVAKLVLESLRAFDVRRSVLLPSEGPLGDYPPTDGGDWYHAGIPVINCISNPVYLLTNDDALQWVDKPRMAAMARAFERILCGVDNISKEQIAARGSFGRRLLLKAMRRVATAKTTAFGLKPVY